MCELMGFSFARPIEADFSMREFSQRGGKENADGWGLAWYPGEAVAIIKEAISWQTSGHTRFLETYSGIRSSIVIAHVRHLTMGRPVHADTHPFSRELNGRDYCFAHNGTLPDARDLPRTRFHPIGQTDSEAFFCHMLEALAKWPGGLSTAENWPRLFQKVQEWNQGAKLNFLLSDGKSLAVYHDAEGWKGLHFKQVLVHDQDRRCFEDADWRVEMGSQPVNLGIVAATVPLSHKGWEPLRRGELIILQDGTMRYSSHRTVGALEKAS